MAHLEPQKKKPPKLAVNQRTNELHCDAGEHDEQVYDVVRVESHQKPPSPPPRRRRSAAVRNLRGTEAIDVKRNITESHRFDRTIRPTCMPCHKRWGVAISPVILRAGPHVAVYIVNSLCRPLSRRCLEGLNQCILSMCWNRICGEVRKGLIDGKVGRWREGSATVTATHWMKCYNGGCNFTPVLRANVAPHRPSRHITVLPPTVWKLLLLL
ncbi:hypothetical protein EVAR_11637_1 [Eumeta japonica]|uniref:Uncharacterized protein n=1 Tax=Eumeta variegata TaxID=151549 RepID=A0A4C1WXU2_EUMVA|nr:hypothetical protein EVAR_11637_1 [Eumeta japonica]